MRGQWMWLGPSITTSPYYEKLISRARHGSTVLDLGCCFGQDLRLLAAQGVPTACMFASDVEPRLWELVYELFRDKGKMEATFLQANILDPEEEEEKGCKHDEQKKGGLTQLEGKVDVVIVCQFLHLFGWHEQLKALGRIVALSQPGTVVIGYQRARLQAKEVSRPWGPMFFHNEETFRDMWREVGERTATVWAVEARLVDSEEWGLLEEDMEWMPADRKSINSVVTKHDA